MNSEINAALEAWVENPKCDTDVSQMAGGLRFNIRLDPRMKSRIEDISRQSGMPMNTLALSAIDAWLSMDEAQADLTRSSSRSSDAGDHAPYLRISWDLYNRIARFSSGRPVEQTVTSLLESAFPKEGDPTLELRRLMETCVNLKPHVSESAATHLDALMGDCLLNVGATKASSRRALTQLREAILRYSIEKGETTS